MLLSSNLSKTINSLSVLAALLKDVWKTFKLLNDLLSQSLVFIFDDVKQVMDMFQTVIAKATAVKANHSFKADLSDVKNWQLTIGKAVNFAFKLDINFRNPARAHLVCFIHSG